MSVYVYSTYDIQIHDTTWYDTILASNGTPLFTPCLAGCLNEVHPDVRRWHPGTVTAAAATSLFAAIEKRPAVM